MNFRSRSKALRAALACGASALAIALAPSALAQQATREESSVYFLRYATEVADGTQVVSASQDLLVARKRVDDRSMLVFDAQNGAVTLERSGHVRTVPLQSRSGPEASYAFDYTTNRVSGTDRTAFGFNMFVRPLLKSSPALGADARWTVATQLESLGMAIAGTAPVKMNVSRTYLQVGGKPAVLIEFDVPAFEYATRDGETVVHWARGFAVTDPGFGEIHALATQHRASILGANGAMRPLSVRTSLHGIDRDGNWRTAVGDAPQIRAAAERVMEASGDQIHVMEAPADGKASTIPMTVAAALDMAAFSAAENSANVIGMSLGASQAMADLREAFSTTPQGPTLEQINASLDALIKDPAFFASLPESTMPNTMPKMTPEQVAEFNRMMPGLLFDPQNQPLDFGVLKDGKVLSPFLPDQTQPLASPEDRFGRATNQLTQAITGEYGEMPLGHFLSAQPKDGWMMDAPSRMPPMTQEQIDAFRRQTPGLFGNGEGPRMPDSAWTGASSTEFNVAPYLGGGEGIGGPRARALMNQIFGELFKPQANTTQPIAAYGGEGIGGPRSRELINQIFSGMFPNGAPPAAELDAYVAQMAAAARDPVHPDSEKASLFFALLAATDKLGQPDENTRVTPRLQEPTDAPTTGGLPEWLLNQKPRNTETQRREEEQYRLLEAQLKRELDEARRDAKREQQRKDSGIDSLDAFVKNNAFDYTSMVGIVPTDLSRWGDWLATQNVRELERFARLAGYPNLASALADAQNLIRQSQDPGYRRWAMQAPSCSGLAGCGPSYLERWWMKQSVVALGDILAESRDIFSTGGFSDIGISGLNLNYLLRDHSLEDGDIVQVKITQFGRTIYQGQVNLTNLGEVFNQQLGRGVASLEIFAVNEGYSPPNTAQVRVDNVVRGQGTQTYSLRTGETATLRIEAGAVAGAPGGTP